MLRRPLKLGLVLLVACLVPISSCGGDRFTSATAGAANVAGQSSSIEQDRGSGGATSLIPNAGRRDNAAGSAGSSAAAQGGEASGVGGSVSVTPDGASGEAVGGSQASGGGQASGGSSAHGCPSAPSGPFELGYFPELRDATTVESHPFFEIENHGATVALNRLALRYYFTNESGEPETAACYWVTGDHCSLAKMTFGDVVAPTADATRYLEVSFPEGAGVKVAPGVFEVRVGFKAGSSMLDQTNDYSFDPAASAPTNAVPFPYKPWLRATLYLDQKLIWGTEPCAVGTMTQVD